MSFEYTLLIAGQRVAGDRTIAVVDPATEAVFVEAPCASPEQLDAAIQAAHNAFPAWSRTPIDARRTLLLRIADIVEADTDFLSPLLVHEHGMTLQSARIEVMVFAIKLRTAAGEALPEHDIDVGPGRRVSQRLLPLGVVAAIVPWNLPLILLATKLGPALLVGNTLVVKPAPTTPLSTLRIGALIADIIPPGVVNIVTDRNDLGAQLTSHPHVRMIAFTGSTATGRRIAAASADSLKRHTLELGGNDPALVLADADLDHAARQIFDGAFLNSGQACIAVKRVYAHASIHDVLVTKLAGLAEAAITGNGFSSGVEFGPLQNRAQYDRVKAILTDAAACGATIRSGPIPAGPGFFIAPTIVSDIPDTARLVTEEQFGPLLPILRFSDEEDAIARANDSLYGLAASVFSADTERALSIASRIEAGTVTINKLMEFHPHIPFGGAKQSGIGTENGAEGLAEFGQIQIIDIAVAA